MSTSALIESRDWSHATPDGRLECDVCPRACRLRDHQAGFCAVRRREGDRITLTTYGSTTGLCIDPIEKKPLYHYLPATRTLSFGTLGCNLGCRFCQNWHMSRSRDATRLIDGVWPEAIATTARAHGCDSVAFTYNEPIIWAEYAIDTARACRAMGLGTVAVTAGWARPAVRAAFFGAMDAANVDLKGFSPEFYRDVCLAGRQALHDVLETLVWLRHESRVWFEITTLLIPGVNDDRAQLTAECAWIARELGPDVPVHFTAFHPDFQMRHVPPTPVSSLRLACRIAADAGLHYVYAGNVRDDEGQSTRCPSCGTAVIERSGFSVRAMRIDAAGRCARCGTAIAGRFRRPGQ